jgi:hypothetical protein
MTASSKDGRGDVQHLEEVVPQESTIPIERHCFASTFAAPCLTRCSACGFDGVYRSLLSSRLPLSRMDRKLTLSR